MAGRRKDTEQLRINVSIDLITLLNILSKKFNKHKGIVLEEMLLDKEKVKKYEQTIFEALEKKHLN